MFEIKEVIRRYKDIIPYLFFGVCTTLVNVIVYWACSHLFELNTMISTVIAWMVAVFFAYITNKKWVFRSTATSCLEIVKEIICFFGCRIATGIIDWLCMYFFVVVLVFDDLVVKVFANILVIVLNYVASRVFVFRKGNQ